MTDTILFVQQPTFNHPLLSSLYLSPLFLSSTLFSCCSWQRWRRDFWVYHSSPRPPLLSVGESLPLLRAHPGCKRLAALSVAVFHSLRPSMRAIFSYSVYPALIKITALVSFSLRSLSCSLGLCVGWQLTHTHFLFFLLSTQIGIEPLKKSQKENRTEKLL